MTTTSDALKDRIHERLQAACDIKPATGCWIFTGSWDEFGTGTIKIGSRSHTVTRAALWVYRHVPLDADYVSVHNHLCSRSPACFNPDHLKVFPNRSKALRYLWRMNGPLHKMSRTTRLLMSRTARDLICLQATTMAVSAIAEEHEIEHQAVVCLLRRRRQYA